jgi:MFS superfamily sulfate permease-like transporter
MVDDMPPGTGREFGGVLNLWLIPQAVFKGVADPAHRPAAVIGLLTIAILSLWAALAPKALRLVSAALLGVVAATAAASLQQHAERTGYNRELIAQGTGNMLCGLLNVLPVTGVIVRTSANHGGRAHTSFEFLHGA